MPQLNENYSSLDRERLFLKVRSLMPSLSDATRKVAEYVTANSDEAMYLNITQLAGKCGVSESTVTKFIRMVGLNGYRDMRIALARSEEQPALTGDACIRLEDDAATLCVNVFQNNIEALSESLKMLDVPTLEAVARAIILARRIDVYALGSSCVAMLNAQMRFYRIGMMINAFEDPHKQMISASNLTAKDVAIGISNSGVSMEVVRALEQARSNGATTVCVTSYENSPIVKASDYALLTCTRDTAELMESMNARVAELSLLDSLYAVVVSNLDKKRLKSLYRSSNVIQKYKSTYTP